MSNLTLPIIVLTVLVGYFFSKEGKNKRVQKVIRTSVNPIEVPNGNNIYTSDIVDNANREILRRSTENYQKAKEPENTGVIPPLFNTYSKIGNPETSPVDDAALQQALMFNQNRINDASNAPKSRPLLERPMFENFLPAVDEPVNDGVVKSLLTGKKLDETHSNMVPFFGSNVKQNIETFSNQPLLDLHTGNTSTFKHKNEVPQFFKQQPENIYGMPIFTNEVSTDRFVQSVFKQNELPMDYERIAAPIAGTIDNDIRPHFKTIDQLRTWDNLKETYEGRTVSGQMGNVRGVQTNVNKNRPDTFYEQGSDRLLKTTGAFINNKMDEDFSTNMKATSRVETVTDYYGGAVSENLKTRQRLSSVNDSSDAIVQEPKRINYENDYTRNIAGNKSTNDYGKSGMNFPETERATTSEENHLLGPQKMTQGIRTKFRDVPKNTVKETTLDFDNTGNVKSDFDKGRINTYTAGINDYNPKTTQKESTMINNYKGIMNREDGTGYLVTKYEAKTTGKETIHSEYQGGANKNTQQSDRTKYANAETRDSKERLLSGERASGPQKFRTGTSKNSHGDIKLTSNMMLKEQVDTRDRSLNQINSQIISGKELIGLKTKKRDDNECLDRLNPELVSQQLSMNPFSMYGK